MRFTRFLKRSLADGVTEVCNFGPADFKAVGLTPALLAGIPQLEAYQLINSWNSNQPTPRFVYFIG